MSCKFLSASEVRNISDLKACHAEVCAIETAILDAMDQGLRTVDICDSPMTLSLIHYNAWFININQNQCAVVVSDPIEQHLLDLQAQVMKCFTDLGYSITRITNPATSTTFCWRVSW